MSQLELQISWYARVQAFFSVIHTFQTIQKITTRIPDEKFSNSKTAHFARMIYDIFLDK